MAETDHERLARHHALDEEPVPLSVAANVAYFHLTHLKRQVDLPGQLADMVQLAAVALSQVAPIREATSGRVLTYREVAEQFFKRRGQEAPVDLDAFSIRRGDLRAALVTLAQVQHLFGAPDA